MCRRLIESPMNRERAISVLAGLVLSILLFIHEQIYDPAPSYTLWQSIQELVIGLPILTLVFGVIIYFAFIGMSTIRRRVYVSAGRRHTK